jgi:hypothetical protein
LPTLHLLIPEGKILKLKKEIGKMNQKQEFKEHVPEQEE